MVLIAENNIKGRSLGGNQISIIDISPLLGNKGIAGIADIKINLAEFGRDLAVIADAPFVPKNDITVFKYRPLDHNNLGVFCRWRRGRRRGW